MAIKALNPFAPFWYTPKSEEGAPNPTKFKIRGMDGAEQGYVATELLLDEGSRAVIGFTGKGLELTLRYGLLDWENFANDDGPVACVPSNFALIDYNTRCKLATRILSASYVSPEEKKTSS